MNIKQLKRIYLQLIKSVSDLNIMDLVALHKVEVSTFELYALQAWAIQIKKENKR